ncbi:MAG: AMIN domain-containing protein [Desulfovibrionaceae bacterium]
MNLPRFLPLFISVLGVLIVLAGWRLGVRWTTPQAVDQEQALDQEHRGLVRGKIKDSARPDGFYADYELMGKQGQEAESAPATASNASEAAPGAPDPAENETTAGAAGKPPEAKTRPKSPSESAETTKEQTAAKTGTSKTAAEPAAEAPGAGVARVRVPGYSPDGRRFTVRVLAQQDIPAATSFVLSDPPRIVVDVQGAWTCPDKPLYRVGPGVVKTVVVGEHPDRLRLVLHLIEGAATPEYSVERSGAEVVVRVQNAAAD